MVFKPKIIQGGKNESISTDVRPGTPNFELGKADEAKLEKIPQIKIIFHDIINNISQKVLSGEELTEREMSELDVVYDYTQSLEMDLVSLMNIHRAKNIISPVEFLIAIDYFLTANQNGPESGVIKNALMDGMIDEKEFTELVNQVPILEHTRAVLLKVYSKIYASKHPVEISK
jgi:superfamily I DNA/RNA helicase